MPYKNADRQRLAKRLWARRQRARRRTELEPVPAPVEPSNPDANPAPPADLPQAVEPNPTGGTVDGQGEGELARLAHSAADAAGGLRDIPGDDRLDNALRGAIVARVGGPRLAKRLRPDGNARDAALALVDGYIPQAIRVVAACMNDDNPFVKLAAAKLLLSRRVGPAKDAGATEENAAAFRELIRNVTVKAHRPDAPALPSP